MSSLIDFQKYLLFICNAEQKIPRWRKLSLTGSLLKCLQWLESQNLEPGTHSESPTWMSRTQVLHPSSAASQGLVEQEGKVRSRKQCSRHYDIAGKCLDYKANHPPCSIDFKRCFFFIYLKERFRERRGTCSSFC